MGGFEMTKEWWLRTTEQVRTPPQSGGGGGGAADAGEQLSLQVFLRPSGAQGKIHKNVWIMRTWILAGIQQNLKITKLETQHTIQENSS